MRLNSSPKKIFYSLQIVFLLSLFSELLSPNLYGRNKANAEYKVSVSRGANSYSDLFKGRENIFNRNYEINTIRFIVNGFFTDSIDKEFSNARIPYNVKKDKYYFGSTLSQTIHKAGIGIHERQQFEHSSFYNDSIILNNVSIQMGATTPAFSPLTYYYICSVKPEQQQIFITATSPVGNVIMFNGQRVVSGLPFGPISIKPGLNTISLVVSNTNTTVSRTYTFDVFSEPVKNTAGGGSDLLPDNSNNKARVTAVFALRKLVNRYTGPAIRVRRKDLLQSEIGFTASGYLDTQSLRQFVGTDTGYVTAWFDQSGNNVHVYQENNTAQPLIIANGNIFQINGRPAIRWTSTSQFLMAGIEVDARQVMAVRQITTGNQQTLFALPANSDYSIRVNGIKRYSGSTGIPNNRDWAFRSGTPADVWVGGVQTDQFEYTPHILLVGSQTTRRGIFSISSTFMGRGMTDGATVSELSIYPQPLTKTERILMEQDKASNYSIPYIRPSLGDSVIQVCSGQRFSYGNWKPEKSTALWIRENSGQIENPAMVTSQEGILSDSLTHKSTNPVDVYYNIFITTPEGIKDTVRLKVVVNPTPDIKKIVQNFQCGEGEGSIQINGLSNKTRYAFEYSIDGKKYEQKQGLRSDDSGIVNMPFIYTSEMNNKEFLLLKVNSLDPVSCSSPLSVNNRLVLSSQSPPTISAGSAQTTCGLQSAPLNATVPKEDEKGRWNQVNGPGTAVFSDTTSPSAIVTVNKQGTYVFRWSIQSRSCTSTSQVVVTYLGKADSAVVGMDQTVNNSLISEPLGGNTPVEGSGSWTFVSGPGDASFSDNTAGNARVSVSKNGIYYFRWVIKKGSCGETSAQIKVTFNDASSITGDSVISILKSYVQYQDSTKIFATPASLAVKMAIQDTTAMLAPYMRTQNAQRLFALKDVYEMKLNISDTVSMLDGYLRSRIAENLYATKPELSHKLNISDTSGMLRGYITKTLGNELYATKYELSNKATITEVNAILGNYLTTAVANGLFASKQQLQEYLPLSGGTLNGMLNGTDARFSGNIQAKKLVVAPVSWSDYVFDSTYYLRPLMEVEKFIDLHHHLPDVPSAKEIADKGVSVGDNQAILLRKIEELTLYIIQQQKRIETLEKQKARKR